MLSRYSMKFLLGHPQLKSKTSPAVGLSVKHCQAQVSSLQHLCGSNSLDTKSIGLDIKKVSGS